MTGSDNKIDLKTISLKFLLITIGMILLSLALAWLIILINGSFTYWSILPLLLGFPITVFININLAKKTIARTRNNSPQGETQDE
ncbi:MAG: hypothetical protein V2J07_04385 [Anaerolineae bacterium]|jgi:hypothetical protein|nr:hypothetical protein [Anaerolineae bacterium]